ncbi:hypothetical protein E4U38_004643 [Claviceps purpurea]|nr:hypothetical protein E4U38_004643 [Claviceps purpurea]
MDTKAPVPEESKKEDAATPMSPPATAATAAPLATAEAEPPADVSDPDEDDLDDLDGELYHAPPRNLKILNSPR